MLQPATSSFLAHHPMTSELAQSEIVVAAFADPHEARQCVEDLRLAGFSEDEIGLVAPDDDLDREEIAEHSMVAEGSVVGAVAGAGLGSLWGIAIAVGFLPMGPIIAGGLLASLVVTAATGAALGSLAGALVGLGVPEEEAAHYEQKLHEGHVVVTVKAQGRSDQARRILQRHNASVQA
jgi:uncharacterized membrane protein